MGLYAYSLHGHKAALMPVKKATMTDEEIPVIGDRGNA